jgi:DNA repair protein RAD16
MACHPDLVLRSKTSKYVQTEEEAVCRLCHDTVSSIKLEYIRWNHSKSACLYQAEDAIVSKCNHLFDRECITQYMLGHEETAVSRRDGYFCTASSC